MLHWVKFNLVGVLGFALQTGVLFVLTHATPQVSYLAATEIHLSLRGKTSGTKDPDPYQLRAIEKLQDAVKKGVTRFLFEMATGTGKTP